MVEIEEGEEEGEEISGQVPPPPIKGGKDCALFWNESDLAAAASSDDPDMIALQSLLYDEDTPEESAEHLKVQGNEALKKGPKFWKNAEQFYTQAIECGGKDDAMNAIIHSNRAHVRLLQGNFGRALEDAKRALQLDGGNEKACYRAARAARSLRKFAEAIAFCDRGLALDGSNAELEKIKLRCLGELEEEKKQVLRMDENRRHAANLAAALWGRGLAVAAPTLVTDGRQPYLDEREVIHWPLLLIYGEHMQIDVIEDVAETETLGPHLDEIFAQGGGGGGGDSPPWDVRGEYSRERVKLYYQKDCSGAHLSEDELARRYFARLEDGRGARDAETFDVNEETNAAMYRKPQWIPVGESSTLSSLLMQKGHVIQGIPVFYVVARNTNFERDFLRGDWLPG